MESHLIKKRFEALEPFLDERLRRIFTAAEALAIGYGGVSIVARETGVSRRAIALGCQELEDLDNVDEKRIRKKGGGRKRAVDRDPNLQEHLESLMEPVMRVVVQSPLRWTCKRRRHWKNEDCSELVCLVPGRVGNATRCNWHCRHAQVRITCRSAPVAVSHLAVASN